MIPELDEMILDSDGELRRYGDSAIHRRTVELAAAKAASKALWLQQRADARLERAARLDDKIRIAETKLAALRRERETLQ